MTSVVLMEPFARRGADTNIRPDPRPQYMRPSSVATMIVQCITAPADVVMDQIVFRPMAESDF